MPSKKYTYVGAPQYGQTKVKSDTHPDILFKPNKKRAREILSAVSYTHLTLPTISDV